MKAEAEVRNRKAEIEVRNRKAQIEVRNRKAEVEVRHNNAIATLLPDLFLVEIQEHPRR